MSDDVDPYDREEDYLRTDGPGCNWCHLGRQAIYVWGPYGTRVCDHCTKLIEAGREWDVVEEAAASLIVSGAAKRMNDFEDWRRRQHLKMARFLEARTDRQLTSWTTTRRWTVDEDDDPDGGMIAGVEPQRFTPSDRARWQLGNCATCGLPLVGEWTHDDRLAGTDDGRTEVLHRVTCPEGHEQPTND